MVEWKKDGTVAIMIMNNGENRQNPDWSNKMLSVYSDILADKEIKAIVLTSSDPKNFSLGVDTDWLMKLHGADNFEAISRWLFRNGEVFKSMLIGPVPTIAAITGHAFGNGAILASACDFRFMRGDKGFFCLPEMDLGIQPAPSMLEWLKKSIPYPLLLKMMLTGTRIGAAELEKNNVILKACADGEETLKDAVAFAKTFNKSRTTMEEMKKRIYKHIIDKIEFEDPVYFACKDENKKIGMPPVFMTTPLT